MAALGLVVAVVAVISVAARVPEEGIDFRGSDEWPGATAERSLGSVLSDETTRGIVTGVLEGAEGEVRPSGLSVDEEARRVLEDYRQRGDCVVAQAGYLDLVGRTWGCVTQGEGWVELCLVSESTDGTSEVCSWHLDAGEVDVGP